MNGIQVYLYTSILQRPADSQQSLLPISGYTFCPRLPLPFTLLPYLSTLHYPASLPVNSALLYPLTLHYPPYPFRNPCSYTQSPTGPSALFRMLAMPLLQMPCKCRHLHTAVKSKKRGLLPVASFLCPRTCTAGLIILHMGSLQLASLPGPIIMALDKF